MHNQQLCEWIVYRMFDNEYIKVGRIKKNRDIYQYMLINIKKYCFIVRHYCCLIFIQEKKSMKLYSNTNNSMQYLKFQRINSLYI